MDEGPRRCSFERTCVHGQVTALSDVVGTVGGRSLVLVGSLSRVYVCEVDESEGGRGQDRHSAVVATKDGVLPSGSTVHGIVVRRSSTASSALSSKDVYHVVAYGNRYVAVMRLEVSLRSTLGSVDPVVARLEVKALRSFQKWVLAVDMRDESLMVGEIDGADGGDGSEGGNADQHVALCMAVGMIDNSVEVCRVVSRGKDGLCSIEVLGRRYGERRCMLYSMDIIGFVVDEDQVPGQAYDVRVAGGTVLFDVVVWRFWVRVPANCGDDVGDEGGSAEGFGGEALVASTVFCGGHTGSVHCVCWDAGGNRVASGSDDRTVRLWMAPWVDLALGPREEDDTTSSPRVVLEHERRVWSLCFVEWPGGGTVYSGLEDGCVTRWDVGTLEDTRASARSAIGFAPVARWGSGKGVRAIRAFERRLLTGGADGSVRVWDADGGTGRTDATVVALRACFEPAAWGEPDAGDPASTPPACGPATMSALAERKHAMGSSFEAIKVMCLVEDGRTLLVATDKGRLATVDIATHAQRVVYASGRSRPLVSIKAHAAENIGVLACCDARGALHLLLYDGTGRGLTEGLTSHVIDGPSRMIDSFFVSHGKRIVLVCLSASGPLQLYDVREDRLEPLPLCTMPSPLGCRITALAHMDLVMNRGMAHESSKDIKLAPSTTLVVMGSAKGGVAVWTLTDGDTAPGGQGHGLLVSLVARQAQGHGATPVQTIALHALHGERVAIETTAMDFCIRRYSLHVAPGSFALNRNNEMRVDAVKTICSVRIGRPLGPACDRNILAGFFAATFLVWDRELDVKVCEFPCAGWKRPWAFSHAGDRIIFCYTSGVGDVHVFKRLDIQRRPPFEIVPGGHGREINSVVDVTGGPGQSLIVTAGADTRLFASQWRRGMLDARCISTQPFGTSTRVLKALRLTPTSAVIVSGGARSIMTAWKAVGSDTDGGLSIEYLSAFANPSVSKWDTLKSQASTDTVDMRVISLALRFSEKTSWIPLTDVDSTPGVLAAIGLSTGEMELRCIPWTHTHRRLHDWPPVAHASTAYPVISMTFADSIVWAGTTNGELIAWHPETGNIETYPAVHASGVNAMAFVPPWNAIVTGGDDQSLSIFCLLARKQRCTVPNAHASAIKDLCILGDDHPILCTIGLDQYLNAWHVSSDKNLMCLGSTLLQVQEPAACCVSGESTVTVVGRGIEQIELKLSCAIY